MTEKKIDEPVNVRTGEELDVVRVRNYLVQAIPDLTGEITVQQFPSGFSNLTYLITIGNRDFILRRPPFGKKAKSAHDMNREFMMLSNLKPNFRYCPEPILYCDDTEVMDSPFYVMERIKGIILRKNLPDGLSYTPVEARRLSKRLIDVLCDLHDLDYKKIGLSDFGKPEGYVKRQVEGWSRRYRDSKTPDAPDCEEVMEWLSKKMPPDCTNPCVIHNDYKLDNVVLALDDPLEIIGILDWEMATIGDPLMDLGNSLAYWIEEKDQQSLQLLRMMPTNLPGMMTRREQVAYYAEKQGMKIDNFDYYYCFGIFRLAVIMQQIYYRFFHGQTRDARFQMLIHGVKIMDDVAKRVINHGEW
ncbi:MAG: phosphotransferase family protein [Spirochaetes bacterium]|nr:phosphotransferase family protein [Spirochaetota bacterium]